MNNYCVMNTEKRKRCDVKGLQDEANREYDDAEKYRNKVDLSKTDDNVYLVHSKDWNAAINDILESNGIKEHDDSVVLLTSVYSASPEWFAAHTKDEWLQYFQKCLEFEQRKGEVINAVVHLDETTPHMQTATVPVVDVPTKVCEQVGVYETGKSKGKPKYKRYNAVDENGNLITHKGLNAAYVIGNKVKMSKEQTAFWEHCGKPHGLERGEIRIQDDEQVKRLSEMEYALKAQSDELAAQQLAMDIQKKTLEYEQEALKTAQDALKADKDALQAERTEFQQERKTWRETANKSLEGYQEAKTAYEAAKTSYDLAEIQVRGIAQGFSLNDVQRFSAAVLQGVQQRCEQVRYSSGRTLWDTAGRAITLAVQAAVESEQKNTPDVKLQEQHQRVQQRETAIQTAKRKLPSYSGNHQVDNGYQPEI